MNSNSDVTFIHESKILSPRQKITIGLVGLVLVVLGAGAWYLWQMENAADDIVMNFGLEEEFAGDTSAIDNLYFDGALLTDPDHSAYIYKYDFDNKTATKAVSRSAIAYVKGNDLYNLALGYIGDTSDPDGLQPVWVDKVSGEIGAMVGVNGFNEREMASKNDKKHYAYAYQTAADSSYREIENWNIAIHNYETGSVETIAAATKPQFMENEDSLVYMTTAGIYKYNLTTKEKTPLFTVFQNLSMFDDFAISPDDRTLITTLPSINSISVAQLSEEGTFAEVGQIYTPNTRYYSPVVSSDSRLYGVVTLRDDEVGNLTGFNAEIRPLLHRSVVNQIELDSFDPETLELNIWTQE